MNAFTSSAGDLITPLNRYVGITFGPVPTTGVDVPLIRSVEGKERLSEAFRYEVKFVSPKRYRNFADMVGQAMTVTLKLKNEMNRYFNGVIDSFHYDGLNDTRRLCYTAVLVPHFALLKHRTDCRIFQNKTSIEIMRTIFADYSGLLFNTDYVDTSGLPRREFCVQYKESDFDFVSRLLEQDGIYYFFEHEQENHHLILINDNSKHKECSDSSITTNITADRFMFDYDTFWEWNETVSLQRHTVIVDDYNHMTPDVDLNGVQQVPAVRIGNIPTSYEQKDPEYDVDAPSGTLKGTTKPGPYPDLRTSYDYPARHVDVKEAEFYAKIRAQEAGCRAYRAQILGSVRQLAVGQAFRAANPFNIADIKEAPLPQKWLAIASDFTIKGESHDLSTPELPGTPARRRKPFLFQGVIEAQPLETQFRPPLVTARPSIQGPQTAVVAGNEGQAVTTDQLDRVKVKFFWDRKGKTNRDRSDVPDENSSCWIRVGQPLAGTGFGAVVLPRYGEEVVVSFVDGNPDWPLVTGVVYNANRRPPEQVTPQAAQSVFRTQTVGGNAESYNMLRFDDTKGGEEVFQRGQKDWRLHANNDCDLRIGNRLAAVVAGGLGLPTGPASWIEATPGSMSLHTTADASNPEGPGSWIELGPGSIRLVVRSGIPGQDQIVTLTPAGIVLVGLTISLTADPPVPDSPIPQITSFPLMPVVEEDEKAALAQVDTAMQLPVPPDQPIRS